MNQPNDTRLNYDVCSYTEKLKRTIAPGLYHLNTPYNDCGCPGLPDDPALRYQSYGPNTCSMNSAIDDSSELSGINHKLTKCNALQYYPGSYSKSSGCVVETPATRSCLAPREDTKLSNPACNLRGTGINRWEWLCHDPQEKAIESFDRVPVNYRMVAKDNHIPLIETPLDQMQCFPKYDGSDLHSGDELIKKWAKGSARDMYAPGFPLGSIDYNTKCK